MRAERLIRISQLLQSRGRLTATELADELAVSPRTIQRDMESLSLAGIPVYATRGAAGGWAMLDTYRAGYSTLTEDEALALVVGQQAQVLAHLGLDHGSDDGVFKLLAALSVRAREHAERARQRLFLDASPWDPQSPDPMLRELHDAIWDDRVVEITYRATEQPFSVSPLGLVAKGSTWYLIALSGDEPRTYRVDRIRELAVSGDTFVRPGNFDLATYWRSSTGEFRETLPSYWVTLLLRGDAVSRSKWVWAKEKRVGTPDPEGWVAAEFDWQNRYEALQAIRVLGNELRIVAPDDLRASAVADAQAFVETNSVVPVGEPS